MTLFGRLILFIAAFGLVGETLLAWQGYTSARRDVVRREEARIQAAAVGLAFAIDGDEHEVWVDAVPEQDGITAWEEGPEGLHHILAAAVDDLNAETDIYILRLRPELREQVEVLPRSHHPEAMEFTVSSAESPYWRHRYAYRPAMWPTLHEGIPSSSGVYEDAHGAWVSAYAPIRTSEGDIVGLLEIDAPLEQVLADVRLAAARDVGAFTVALLGVLGSVVLVARRMGRGLAGVEASARRIGAGDLETPVPESRVVGSLASGLESARAAIHARILDLEGEREELGRRLLLARQGIDEPSAARRAFLDRQPIYAGNSTLGFHPAELLDLYWTGGAISVRRVLDLPLGTPLELRIDGNPSLEAVIRSRISTDAGVELALNLVPHQLEALTVELKRGLDLRRALRLRPDAALSMAVDDGGGPIRVEVQDVSIHGASVRVAAPIERLSLWGRSLGVLLRDGEDRLSTRGTIASLRPLGPDITLVGLDLSEAGPEVERALTRVLRRAERSRLAV